MTSVTRDPTSNPFTPGYGNLPRVFAGRALEFTDLELLAMRAQNGIYEQARMVTGVRGIGKTALLKEYSQWLAEQEAWTVSVAAPPGTALLGRLATAVGGAVLDHDLGARAATKAVAILRVAASLALRFGQPDWHVEYRGAVVQPGGATGDPGQDLGRALSELCHLARERRTFVALLVDEAQNADAAALAPLLYALQEVQGEVITVRDATTGRVERSSLPLAVVLSGLPSLPAAVRRAHATFMARAKGIVLGPLEEAAVREALPAFTQPMEVEWDADAVDSLVQLARGYPYFLHVYGYHAWNAGDGPTITDDEVAAGAQAAAPLLDAFFNDRLEELTDLQLRVARAVASLPPAERTPTAIAQSVGRRAGSGLASTIDGLVERGVLRRVAHGRYTFQIPGLGAYLRDA